MGSYLLTNRCGCIRYPHIIKSEQLLVSDGVHLTDLSSEVVLNTLQGALVNLEECLIFKDMSIPSFKSCCIQFQCNDNISHMHLLYLLSLM